jgi:hypothetical protein
LVIESEFTLRHNAVRAIGRAKTGLGKEFLPTPEFLTQIKQLLGVINRKRRLLWETPRILRVGLIRGNR